MTTGKTYSISHGILFRRDETKIHTGLCGLMAVSVCPSVCVSACVYMTSSTIDLSSPPPSKGSYGGGFWVFHDVAMQRCLIICSREPFFLSLFCLHNLVGVCLPFCLVTYKSPKLAKPVGHVSKAQKRSNNKKTKKGKNTNLAEFFFHREKPRGLRNERDDTPYSSPFQLCSFKYI